MKRVAIIFGLLAIMSLAACAGQGPTPHLPYQDESTLSTYIGQPWQNAAKTIMPNDYKVGYSKRENRLAMLYVINGQPWALVLNELGKVMRVQPNHENFEALK